MRDRNDLIGNPTINTAHSAQSSTREKVIEHLFAGELLRSLWRNGVRDIEVLRAEVDKGGYDLVLEANGFQAVKNLEATEVGLLDCHEYDKLRKRMLVWGLNESQLASIGLEALEEKQYELRRFVETHEIRY